MAQIPTGSTLDWELVESIVSAMAASVKVAVTVKIRLLQTEAQTVEFARRLRRVGASLLAVHGRQRGSQVVCDAWVGG